MRRFSALHILANMRFLLGIIVGVVLVAGGLFAYLRMGNVPVATSDSPFPMERQITHMALDARIDKEMIKNPPIAANDATFLAGATVYRQECASCHGMPGKDSEFAKYMFPDAPQLFVKHRRGNVVGVSDDPPGETYWKVANGIRLTGMPSYKNILSETEMWQVAQLLANADKLPADVTAALQPAPVPTTLPTPPTPPTPATPPTP
jgi:thiosulfate dehydrogenase